MSSAGSSKRRRATAKTSISAIRARGPTARSGVRRRSWSALGRRRIQWRRSPRPRVPCSQASRSRMSLAWPTFSLEPLDDGRTWSATFESYDERHDDVYYVVTLSDGTDLMAQCSTTFSSNAWIETEVRDTLRERIGRVAATGKSNTDYRGPVLRS